MEIIEQRLKHLNNEINLIDLQPDQVATWKANPVTRRLLLEIEYQIYESLVQQNDGSPVADVNSLACYVNYSNGFRDALELVRNWDIDNNLE